MGDCFFILHVVPDLQRKSGGPSRTVVQLSDELSCLHNLNISLISQNLSSEPTVPSKTTAVNRITVKSNSKIILNSGFSFFKKLLIMFRKKKPNIIHSHGLWTLVNHWIAFFSRCLNVPLIIQPRGMLEPWAMNHKLWKKKIAMVLFQQRDLKSAKAIVATSNEEYQNIRKLGFTNPIAVIPNGIEFPEHNLKKGSTVNKYRNVLFLSRIHPKKGLINLLQAWSEVASQGWRLQIAGPNEGGHLSEVMVEAHRLGIQNCVKFLGEVDGAEKSAVYQNADLFVLPTFSENFGVVVAEALSYGVPVITTKGAPWKDLPEYQCGWWVDIGVEPLAEALRDGMALDDAERYAMGERGKAYVKRYDWQNIAQQTAAMYAWVLGQGPKPDFIYLD